MGPGGFLWISFANILICWSFSHRFSEKWRFSFFFFLFCYLLFLNSLFLHLFFTLSIIPSAYNNLHRMQIRIITQ